MSSNFNVLLWIEDRDYYSIEGILVMNGPFFDLCAMSKFVHYAKYSHDPIVREKKEGTRAKLTSLSLSPYVMNERLHYWGHFFIPQWVKTNG